MTVPILFAGNQRVFDGMVIAALSIVKYRRDPVHIYLLTMDLRDVDETFTPITECQRAYLEDIYRTANKESRVEILEAGQFYRETLLGAPNEMTLYTPYAFLRLFAHRFPELPSKIIYLDTDTVLCGDIEELYRIDLENCEFAGVRDYYGHRFFGVNYVNSGVLLLDLDRVRATGLFDKALDACAKKKIFLPDQTALNRLVKKKKILPRRYNEQHRERPDTLIRHFSMTIIWLPKFRTQNIKPWHTDLVWSVLKTHYFDDILKEYLARKEHFPVADPKENQT